MSSVTSLDWFGDEIEYKDDSRECDLSGHHTLTLRSKTNDQRIRLEISCFARAGLIETLIRNNGGSFVDCPWLARWKIANPPNPKLLAASPAPALIDE
jgi:hypothetical protein